MGYGVASRVERGATVLVTFDPGFFKQETAG